MEIYFEPKNPGSLGGLDRLKRQLANQSRKKVRDYLAGQKTYALHKPLRRRFKRRKILVRGIDDLWQADLADFLSLSRQNGGYKYVLVVIDVFSKYLWALPLKNKRAATTLEALKSILETARPRKPNHFMTDKGTEFALVARYLPDEGVNYYTAENPETKASIAERVIRTIKGRIYRYFTHTGKYRYLDVLPDIIDSYNNSRHRSIGMKPVEVNKGNEGLVRKKLYPPNVRRYPPPYKYRVGDKVRISLTKDPAFTKGYKNNWSEEIFIIHKQLPTYPPVYELKDDNKEILRGTFYKEELQRWREL